MTVIRPVQAFVQKMIAKFDEINTPNVSEDAALFEQKRALLDKFKAEECAAAVSSIFDIYGQSKKRDSELSDCRSTELNSKLYEVYKSAPNLKTLFEITEWLNPPTGITYDHQSMLTNLILDRLEKMGRSSRPWIPDSTTPHEKFYSYIFETVFKESTPEERKVLLSDIQAQLDILSPPPPLRTLELIRRKVADESGPKKIMIFALGLLASALVGLVVLPTLKGWVADTVFPVLVSCVKILGPTMLLRTGESIYHRAVAIDQWFLQSLPELIKTYVVGPQVSISTIGGVGLTVGTICTLVPPLCLPLSTLFRIGFIFTYPINPTRLLSMGIPFFNDWGRFVFDPGADVRMGKMMKGRDEPIEAVMKVYHVWMKAMTKGPQRGLFA